MKCIHCADVHLGAKLDSFPKEVADDRKIEVRNTFSRMVEFAKANGVGVILLSGDIFDREKPYKKDTDFFYNVVESHPDIDFLYLRGNHDEEGERRTLPNLKTFSSEWRYYEYGDTVIAGIELCKENFSSYPSTLALAEKKTNIVMLHGQIGEEITLTKLRDKHIDYLALGHVHEFSEGELDGRGRYAYSGCLEGRGFDETGAKGFVVLEIEDKVRYRFQPFSKRNIYKYALDVSGLKEGYAMAKRARETLAFSKEDVYRVELVGEVEAEVDEFAKDVYAYLCQDCAFLSVKDCTKKKIDYAAYAHDTSLKGEFVRTVAECTDYTEEERAQIIAYGLKALSGREVDA